MIIERIWSMPNSKTFKIKPIKELIQNELVDGVILDPFANECSIKDIITDKQQYISNDLDKSYDTDYHSDALEFLKQFEDNSVDMVLYDPPYCYDKETEVFTKDGWKFFNELNYTDEIATLNTETNELEYSKPLEIIKKKYKGEMISIESQSISALITPNHRMWLKNSFYGKYSFQTAQDMIKQNAVWFQKSCDYKGIEQDYFYLPEVELLKSNRYGEKVKKEKKIKMDIWLKFLGLFLSEGCCKQSNVNKHKYRVNITQKKKENIKIIEDVLKELGFNYIHHKYDYTIQDKQLWMYLNQFGKSRDKYIPKDIKNLSKRQLQILINYLMIGDGTNKRYKKLNVSANKYYHYDTNSYCTGSKKLMNDFCEIAIKCGHGISVHNKIKKGYDKVYDIHMLKAKHFKVYNKNFGIVKSYNDYVYCVHVPNSTVLVKRKGRIYWCGNSPRQISECYKKLNKSVNMQTTQASYWGNQKNEIARIVKKGGKVITFGWNSGGIGKTKGFKIEKILLVPHGGWHNDTICTVERKVE